MRNRLIITSAFLFVFIFSLTAQKLVNSPYARFNIGILEPAGSFRSLGMGGTGVALRDNNSIYINNPASYSSIDTNSFIFDFGMDYSFNKLLKDDSEFFSDDMNFDHLLIGFPISKGFGVAAGIIPHSNGYYKISENVENGDPGYDPVTGEYSILHKGIGGFTKFFVGSGLKITGKLSAGINMTALFGQIERNNSFLFTEFYNAFNINSSEKLRINGINLDYGLQYSSVIWKDYFLNAGLSLTSSKKYKSVYENYSYLFSSYSTTDTISYINDSKNRISLPVTYMAGLSFGKKDRFVIGADFVVSGWSKAKIPGSEGYQANTKSFMVGAEYIPDRYSSYSTLKRFRYRLGCHVGDNYLIINDYQIKEFGISAGIGMPMRRTFSETNIFVDFTRRSGSSENNLHTENYLTVGVSLNLHELWFLKLKYD